MTILLKCRLFFKCRNFNMWIQTLTSECVVYRNFWLQMISIESLYQFESASLYLINKWLVLTLSNAREWGGHENSPWVHDPDRGANLWMQAVSVPEPEPGRGEPYICQAPRQTLSIQVRRYDMEINFSLQLRIVLLFMFGPQYILY